MDRSMAFRVKRLSANTIAALNGFSSRPGNEFSNRISSGKNIWKFCTVIRESAKKMNISKIIRNFYVHDRESTVLFLFMNCEKMFCPNFYFFLLFELAKKVLTKKESKEYY